MSNDEFQDIEEDSLDQFDEEFETGGGASFGDLWKHSPIVKIGVVLAGFVIILGGIVLFGGEEERPLGSSANVGSGVKGTPGTEEVSPEMQREIEEYNIEQVEEAIQEGGSALPVPISTPRGGVLVGQQDVAEDDPLQRWRRIQEERQKREQQAPPDLPEVDPNIETIDALAKAMLQQMQSVVGTEDPRGMQHSEVTNEEKFYQDREKKQQQELEDAENDDSPPGEGEPVEIIVPAGTIEYAQLLIEANSDVPGPVLAQIAGGPLSGSRVLGTFAVEDKHLVLTFNAIVIDGVSHSTNAVALNPDTSNPGLVTDYDARLFKRVFLPAAATFITGFAEAVATSGTTSVTVNEGAAVQEEEELDTEQEIYAGLQEGATSVSDFLNTESDQTEAFVKVAAGTPIAILFTQPVTKE